VIRGSIGVGNDKVCVLRLVESTVRHLHDRHEGWSWPPLVGTSPPTSRFCSGAAPGRRLRIIVTVLVGLVITAATVLAAVHAFRGDGLEPHEIDAGEHGHG
jgi:hypothetical protein